MLPGLYSAASGLDVSIRNQEAIAHNLAHVNVPGFRRSSVAFESFESTLEEAEFGNLSSSSGVSETGYIDFTPGTYEQTGRSLDVAIKGDGFFPVEAPDGPRDHERNSGQGRPFLRDLPPYPARRRL